MIPRLTQRRIDAEDQEMLKRQARFRAAADMVTDALVRFAEVEAVALIGSVARPLRCRAFGDKTSRSGMNARMSIWRCGSAASTGCAS